MILMSQPDYSNFIKLVKSGKHASKFDCSGLYCFTDEKCRAVEPELDDLVIQLDGTNYSVPPFGYLVENY